MERFYGKVGYVGETVEDSPGVHVQRIVEHAHYGDVIRDSRRFDGSQKVNPDLTIGNSISIVADAYISSHVHSIRYVEFAGALWTISEVEIKSPRIILRLGGVYDGETPETSPDPDGPDDIS